MNIEILNATKNNSLELSEMTGESLYEIMDKINVKAFNFNLEDIRTSAKCENINLLSVE